MGGVQYRDYGNGAFCAHKIPYNGGTYSAYYAADGTLRDAERTGLRTRTGVRGVSARETNVRAALERIGRRFAATRAAGAGV
jgi:hypothetical protein